MSLMIGEIIYLSVLLSFSVQNEYLVEKDFDEKIYPQLILLILSFFMIITLLIAKKY